MSCYVTLCTPAEAGQLYQKLVVGGYEIDSPPFTRFRARKPGVSCMVYLSGKVLVQGSALAPFLAEFFPSSSIPTTPITPTAPTTIPVASNLHVPCMGFDESGKGDVFGPLCLAGVYVGDQDAAQLVEWGVCDSKRLTEKQILALAPKIRQHYPHETLVLTPKRYNALYAKFRNLNRLMVWGHVELMAALYKKTKCTRAMLDQFCAPHEVESVLERKQKEIVLTQATQAESAEIAVAAASIVARAAFVEEMKALSQEFGFTLPKGATHGIVTAGKRVLKEFGEEGLEKTMKLHFKTLVAIRGR